MGKVFYFEWEVRLMEWMQGNQGSFGNLLAKGLSLLGDETAVIVIFLILYFCYKKEVGKRVGATVMAAAGWFPMIKNVAVRQRPYMVHEKIICLAPPEKDAALMDIVQQGFSFPSGHAALSVAMYGGIAREVRKWWMTLIAVILPILIGISRFAVGVHYPTDVLIGWALGALSIGFFVLLQKYVKNENVRNVILLATMLPGLFWCDSRDYFTSLGLMIGMIFAFPFEKKYVNFADTRKFLYMALRVLGGLAIYYVLNTLMKLPFSTEFLNNGTLGANLIRTARYAVIVFVIAGVYPMCFRLSRKKETQDA